MTPTASRGKKLTLVNLASEAGVGVETVRYYQRRGLLAEPPKPVGHHRSYTKKDLARLMFVKRAKAAGFTLREIATLLSLGADHCAATKSLAKGKLKKIEGRIAELREVHDRLQALIEACDTGDQGRECGLFVSLRETDRDG